jgi:hypothetical protein
MNTRPRLDLIPGTDQDFPILLIVLIALLYVGTGGWHRERWKDALSVAGPAIGTLMYGKKKGEECGWEKGYNTYNPALRETENTSWHENPEIEQ